jgi:hypothetical protein
VSAPCLPHMPERIESRTYLASISATRSRKIQRSNGPMISDFAEERYALRSLLQSANSTAQMRCTAGFQPDGRSEDIFTCETDRTSYWQTCCVEKKRQARMLLDATCTAHSIDV